MISMACCDLFLIVEFEQDAVMHQHAVGTRSASHSRLAASRSISAPPDCIGKLYSVRLFGECEICSDQPSYSDAINSLQHRALRLLGAPCPERRVALLMPDDHFTGDHRMPTEPARQRRHAHAVIDAELQRLHPWPLQFTFRRVFPAFDVGLTGQAAESGERVVDVASQIVFRQLRIAAVRRGNPDLLGSPIEIKPDLVGRKLHERAHCRRGH